MSAIPPDTNSYFIFHGTGTSTALPIIPCITSHPLPHGIPCDTCRSCVDGSHDGWKNVRGNTGGIWRRLDEAGVWRNIVIDVGKTFRQNALKIFREHQITRIDAVILTHGHADAIAGLDDLRPFTQPPYPGAPRPPPLPVHLSAQTLNAVALQYPYLVDKNKATGGGSVPTLDWRVWGDEMSENENEGQDEFWVAGLKVLPLKVHHGQYFTPPSKKDPPPLPLTQGSNTPINPHPNPDPDPDAQPRDRSDSSLTPTNIDSLKQKTTLAFNQINEHHNVKELELEAVPFWCYGFLFDEKTLYISDVSYIPEETWELLLRNLNVAPSDHSAEGKRDQPKYLPYPKGSRGLPEGKIETLILDCLRIEPYSSHLSYVQAVSIAMHMKARETLLVGFTHPDRHALWESLGRVLRDGNQAGLDAEQETFLNRIESGAERQGLEGVWEEAKRWGGIVMPAFDGQIVKTG